jgi:hypothetical protein
MSNRKAITSLTSCWLGPEAWTRRQRDGGACNARFMAAMAADEAVQREEPKTERRVDIELTHYASGGARYRVTYLGETLIASARDPEFEACRALLAKGIIGTLVTYGPGGTAARMRIDIEDGAKLTTIENANEGPRIGRYRPHPGTTGQDDAE